VGTTAQAELPAVSVHDAQIVEGDSGSVRLRFEVEANGPPRRIDLGYSVSDLTPSIAEGDYAPTSGTLTLIP
jgi:hypothetical protein